LDRGDGGFELLVCLRVFVGFEKDAAEDRVGIGCDLRVVGIVLDYTGGERFCMVEIAAIEGDRGVLNLHRGKIRGQDECGIDAVGGLVILAGTGAAEGELSERVGDEDPVLLCGVGEQPSFQRYLTGEKMEGGWRTPPSVWRH
jgi:hypothetical protein